MEYVGAIILIVVLFFLCLLPSFIAKFRGHRNTGPIVILNIVVGILCLVFFGWLGWGLALIAWIIALVWSCTSNTDKNKAKDALMLAKMMKEGAR
jgi:O-antigen/teichoic acid export membrane protein